jgi:hypothetical protein
MTKTSLVKFPLIMQVLLCVEQYFLCQASDIISIDIINAQTQEMLILGKNVGIRR